MLGCLVVDHVKVNSHSSNGKMVLVAVTDVLLTKLMFEEWRSSEEKSDELYRSRFKYFAKKFKKNSKELNIRSWFHLAMVPIGISAETLDEAQLEARRCLRMMDVHSSKQVEGEVLACLIFLGKEGLNKEAIPYFLEAEYQIKQSRLNTSLGHAIRTLLKCENFETYLEEVCKYKGQSYRMMCGGLGQVYYNRIPGKWVNPTLDDLEDDIKAMTLSFMKTFNCLPSW